MQTYFCINRITDVCVPKRENKQEARESERSTTQENTQGRVRINHRVSESNWKRRDKMDKDE